MEGRKTLVLVTALLGCALFALAVHFRPMTPASSLQIKKEFPTTGTGPVQLVIFEDLRCAGCREFHLEIFPEIFSRHIQTGQAQYISVILAFLENSKPLGNAALCVYHIAPQQFLPFVQGLFSLQESTHEAILNLAEQIGGIDLSSLEKCLDAETYYGQLDSNFSWAKQALGTQLRTPTLLVNGVPMATLQIDEISKAIEQAGAK